jgi:hypothetical protein
MSGSSYRALQIPLKGALVFKCEPWVPNSSDYEMTCDVDDATDKQQTVLPYKKRCAPRNASRTLKTNGKHLSVPVQIGKPRIKKAKTDESLIKFMDEEAWRRKHLIDRKGWFKLSKADWFEDGHEIKTNGKLKFSEISGFWVEHNVKFDGTIKCSTAQWKEDKLAESDSTKDKRMLWAVDMLPTFELVNGVETTPWWSVESENDKSL